MTTATFRFLRSSATAVGLSFAVAVQAQDSAPPSGISNAPPAQEWWNFHLSDTETGQFHPSFPAQYSGSQSLGNQAASVETVSVDVMAGLRLWRNAELHVDGLAWQGFGFNHTLGLEAFPNAAAYKVGARLADATFARVFVRQTFGLGGAPVDVPSDGLHLAGQQDPSRVVVTVGEMSVQDIFDHNSYAGDPASQFMNWALVGNEAWDYPANSLGYITGLATELYLPPWVFRYGLFQVPRQANGLAEDPSYLRAWGMVLELERDWQINGHAGVARALAYANHARMGTYEAAVDDSVRPADISLSQGYRYKYGFCLNMEQEIARDVGLFTRLGWSDGHTEAWAYSDVDDSVSLGVSLSGDLWLRPADTLAMAGVVSAISRIHQEFFEDGGMGILAGDGALSYGMEKAMETYYKYQVWKSLYVSADYQLFIDPAFNRARGPVSVLGGRVHWDF